jgi:hypothetical protein
MFVVISGNPFDGLKIHGPFSDGNEANDWASGSSELKNETWWVVSVTEPSPS